MAEIILGTTNPSKLERLGQLLEKLPVQCIGIAAVQSELSVPPEVETDPGDVAMTKALSYAAQLDLRGGSWVLAMDDMATLKGVTDEEHACGSFKDPVERTFGVFNPTTALKYYGALAKKYGGTIPVEAHYGLALAGYPLAGGAVKGLSTTAKLNYQLVSKPPKDGVVPEGYPLSSLFQVTLPDGQKYMRSELTAEQVRLAEAPLIRGIRGLLLHAGIISMDFKGVIS